MQLFYDYQGDCVYLVDMFKQLEIFCRWKKLRNINLRNAFTVSLAHIFLYC